MAKPGDKIMLDPEYYEWRQSEGRTAFEPPDPIGEYNGEDLLRQVVYGTFGAWHIVIPLRYVRFLQDEGNDDAQRV